MKNWFKKNNEIDKVRAIGGILYPNDEDKFNECILLFQTDKDEFEEVFPSFTEDLDIEDLDLKYLLFAFGDMLKKVVFIDWRGEENEGELESHVTEITQKKYDWMATTLLRNNYKGNQTDGKFILQLFKAINEDLKITNEQLLFFNNDWDGYGFVVVTNNQLQEFQKISKTILIPVGKLKI